MVPFTLDPTEVLIVGAGPAGLMLSTILARLGIPHLTLDDRYDLTDTGRADGLQPKTLETLSQLRLLSPLLDVGVKIFDISYWSGTPDAPLHRVRREIHFPKEQVDLVERFILLVHQGIVEGVMVDDLKKRGKYVRRDCEFLGYEVEVEEGSREGQDGRERGRTVRAWWGETGNSEGKGEGGAKRGAVRAGYLVGCDGAHSVVRKAMGASMVGENKDVFWGVLDGVLETAFPDLWSKCAISSHDKGSILVIPRERGMTRLYIELPGGNREVANKEYVMARAREIMAPYTVEWKTVEWFGLYQIGQRVASKFSDQDRVFIAGDAAHTHSPKAAQGMNVSMHDTFNLAWKLAMVIKGLSPPSILETYTSERLKIAQDLIAFDHGHAAAFSNTDAAALAANFAAHIRFISGVGADYAPNVLNLPLDLPEGAPIPGLVPGQLLTPARATRWMDANPVHMQRDIPMLGQWRVYFLVGSYGPSKPLIEGICSVLDSNTSVIYRANANSADPELYRPTPIPGDEFVQPARYLPDDTQIVTYSLITTTPRSDVEVTDLPVLLQRYRWAFYIDDLGPGVSPVDRWCGGGGLSDGETVLVCVRPDGYVGAVSKRWRVGDVEEVGKWMEGYFGGFLLG